MYDVDGLPSGLIWRNTNIVTSSQLFKIETNKRRNFSLPLQCSLHTSIKKSIGIIKRIQCIVIDKLQIGHTLLLDIINHRTSKEKKNKLTTSCFTHALLLCIITYLSSFYDPQGKCQRKDPPCKYLHPPQHLREQLLQNGRNNLILRNLQLQASYQQAHLTGVLPMVSVWGLWGKMCVCYICTIPYRQILVGPILYTQGQSLLPPWLW